MKETRGDEIGFQDPPARYAFFIDATGYVQSVSAHLLGVRNCGFGEIRNANPPDWIKPWIAVKPTHGRKTCGECAKWLLDDGGRPARYWKRPTCLGDNNVPYGIFYRDTDASGCPHFVLREYTRTRGVTLNAPRTDAEQEALDQTNGQF